MNPQQLFFAGLTKDYLIVTQSLKIIKKLSFMFPKTKVFVLVFLFLCMNFSFQAQNQNATLDENSDYHVNAQTLGRTPIAGDTIFVSSERTFPLRFENIIGDSLSPVVVINKGGQVKINDTINTWGAITFENCKHIKISGAGHPGFKYGFELAAVQSGLGFTELSSDCEAEFIKISHDGFFGILAKKDYGGNPPFPYPVFENLIIHDCFIENVSEGMYLGETKTPGMEFKHVKIYNNIIRNTEREAIQIANMVEDVEIYNNTMINSGLEGAYAHMNNLQIGNNSVANVYNNILIDAPVFGIINMGKGNCTFTNNYIASSQGIFCDDRSISDSLAPININQNYFRSIAGNQIVRNMNEINYLTLEGNSYDTDITFYLNQTVGALNNFTLSNNSLASVSEIQFTDPSNNDYSLASGTAVEYLNMGASSGPEFFEFEDPATTPAQIIIVPSMVIDSVQTGSVFSPLFLFDEQNIDVEANEHPVSDPWKPDFQMNESSYHAIVDLGEEFYISEINLHDINSTFNFTVEYLTFSGWNTLFVEPCDDFNVWKKHLTDISTRFFRLSMYDSPYAAINEITIHGYPAIKEPEQIVITSDMVIDLVVGGSVLSPQFLFDEQSIDFEFNEHPLSSSWKPFYTDVNAPYCAMLDLGKEYHISDISLHDMNGIFDLIVEYGNGTTWTELFVEPCDSYNIWKTHETDITTRYLRFKMAQSPYAAVNEIFISGYPVLTLPGTSVEPTNPEPEPETQIIVTSGMITDLVSGGSVNSPQFLFDEQVINPIIDEHPTGNPWKPYYTNVNAPYYATIDLNQEYHISKIYLHDINGTDDFNVEFDDNSNWTSLFIESCDSYNVWQLHEVDIDTQYLRLGMLDSPYAAVNEIILFGYPLSNSSKQVNKKNNTVDVEQISGDNEFELYPNPVTEKLYLRFPKEMIGTNYIRISDILGKEVYSKDVNITEESLIIELNIETFLSASGFYILSSSNVNGEHQVKKFFKE